MKKSVDFSDIKGHEHVKRGLEVALAGNHSVTLIGPPNSGKSMLREAARGISKLIKIDMAEPCPCGYFTDPTHECHCEPKDILKHIQTIPNNEIHLEVPRLKLEHLTDKRRGESTDVIIKKLNDAWTDRVHKMRRILDKEATELLKLVVLELGISPTSYDKIVRVANTIAYLDGKGIIEAHHISEAISYRSLDRNLWG